MQDKIKEVLSSVNKVILDKEIQTEIIFATWLMGGHVLLEDVPGTGKTVLAKAFSKVCQMNFGRVQFTPDLLPSDILGTTIYDSEKQKFFFRRGPLFSQFFLADEINRATPRTQSALLEAMGERQITVENKTTLLPESFFVMATQNPLEQHGTFPLPEAQLDRFTVKMSLGLVDLETEMRIIKSQNDHHPLEYLKPIFNETMLIEMKNRVSQVRIDDDVLSYLLQIIHMTRNHPELKHGASPRASIAFTKLSQALAIVKNRDYVNPSDIYFLAPYVLGHRIILNEEALFDGKTPQDIIKEVLKNIKAPRL